MTKEEYYGKHYTHMKNVESNVVREMEALYDKVVSRIKSPESMNKKLQGDCFEPTAENALKYESDYIGVRIITGSLKEVYEVAAEICQRYHVVSMKDYIKKPKESGYRSMHVIIETETEDMDMPVMKVEIQIRTATIDCWASLEHIAKYKQTIPMTEEIEELLDVYYQEFMSEIEEIQMR